MYTPIGTGPFSEPLLQASKLFIIMVLDNLSIFGMELAE